MAGGRADRDAARDLRASCDPVRGDLRRPAPNALEGRDRRSRTGLLISRAGGGALGAGSRAGGADGGAASCAREDRAWGPGNDDGRSGSRCARSISWIEGIGAGAAGCRADLARSVQQLDDAAAASGRRRDRDQLRQPGSAADPERSGQVPLGQRAVLGYSCCARRSCPASRQAPPPAGRGWADFLSQARIPVRTLTGWRRQRRRSSRGRRPRR